MEVGVKKWRGKESGFRSTESVCKHSLHFLSVATSCERILCITSNGIGGTPLFTILFLVFHSSRLGT